MTRNEAVAILKARLGNYTQDSLDTIIINELKLTQIELEEREWLPWFLLSEEAETQTTAGDWRVPVPGDFLMEWETGSLWYYDSSVASGSDPYKDLVKDDWEVIRNDEDYLTPGKPKAYDLVGDYFNLAPTPDATYTLKMVYYKEDTKLDSDVENDWLKHAPSLMIAITGARIAGYVRRDKPEIALQFAQEAQSADRTLLKKTEARCEVNKARVMGG